MSILNADNRAALVTWHDDLNAQQGRRLRATLRHSNSLTDIHLSEGFRSLLIRTPSLWKRENETWRFSAMGIVAAIASHIRTIDESQPFARQLARTVNGRTLMSELRFKRLQEVRTQEDLVRQLRRAVQLLGGTVNLPDLAEGIFCWVQEEDERITQRMRQRRPTEHIHVRWAMEYYMAVNEDTAESTVADKADTQEKGHSK